MLFEKEHQQNVDGQALQATNNNFKSTQMQFLFILIEYHQSALLKETISDQTIVHY